MEAAGEKQLAAIILAAYILANSKAIKVLLATAKEVEQAWQNVKAVDAKYGHAAAGVATLDEVGKLGGEAYKAAQQGKYAQPTTADGALRSALTIGGEMQAGKLISGWHGAHMTAAGWVIRGEGWVNAASFVVGPANAHPSPQDAAALSGGMLADSLLLQGAAAASLVGARHLPKSMQGFAGAGAQALGMAGRLETIAAFTRTDGAGYQGLQAAQRGDFVEVTKLTVGTGYAFADRLMTDAVGIEGGVSAVANKVTALKDQVMTGHTGDAVGEILHVVQANAEPKTASANNAAIDEAALGFRAGGLVRSALPGPMAAAAGLGLQTYEGYRLVQSALGPESAATDSGITYTERVDFSAESLWGGAKDLMWGKGIRALPVPGATLKAGQNFAGSLQQVEGVVKVAAGVINTQGVAPSFARAWNQGQYGTLVGITFDTGVAISGLAVNDIRGLGVSAAGLVADVHNRGLEPVAREHIGASYDYAVQRINGARADAPTTANGITSDAVWGTLGLRAGGGLALRARGGLLSRGVGAEVANESLDSTIAALAGPKEAPAPAPAPGVDPEAARLKAVVMHARVSGAVGARVTEALASRFVLAKLPVGGSAVLTHAQDFIKGSALATSIVLSGAALFNSAANVTGDIYDYARQGNWEAVSEIGGAWGNSYATTLHDDPSAALHQAQAQTQEAVTAAQDYVDAHGGVKKVAKEAGHTALDIVTDIPGAMQGAAKYLRDTAPSGQTSAEVSATIGHSAMEVSGLSRVSWKAAGWLKNVSPSRLLQELTSIPRALLTGEAIASFVDGVLAIPRAVLGSSKEMPTATSVQGISQREIDQRLDNSAQLQAGALEHGAAAGAAAFGAGFAGGSGVGAPVGFGLAIVSNVERLNAAGHFVAARERADGIGPVKDMAWEAGDYKTWTSLEVQLDARTLGVVGHDVAALPGKFQRGMDRRFEQEEALFRHNAASGAYADSGDRFLTILHKEGWGPAAQYRGDGIKAGYRDYVTWRDGLTAERLAGDRVNAGQGLDLPPPPAVRAVNFVREHGVVGTARIVAGKVQAVAVPLAAPVSSGSLAAMDHGRVGYGAAAPEPTIQELTAQLGVKLGPASPLGMMGGGHSAVLAAAPARASSYAPAARRENGQPPDAQHGPTTTIPHVGMAATEGMPLALAGAHPIILPPRQGGAGANPTAPPDAARLERGLAENGISLQDIAQRVAAEGPLAAQGVVPVPFASLVQIHLEGAGGQAFEPLAGGGGALPSTGPLGTVGQYPPNGPAADRIQFNPDANLFSPPPLAFHKAATAMTAPPPGLGQPPNALFGQAADAVTSPAGPAGPQGVGATDGIHTPVGEASNGQASGQANGDITLNANPDPARLTSGADPSFSGDPSGLKGSSTLGGDSSLAGPTVPHRPIGGGHGPLAAHAAPVMTLGM